MSFTIIGTVKSAGVYDVNGKNASSKQMISFSVADGLGNVYPCQMWPDDPGFVNLAAVIESYRRRQVQLTVVSYTVRMRQFQSGQVAPWANFIVSEVVQPAQGSLPSAVFSGIVKSGNVSRPEGGKKPYVWLNACNELGTTFACRMWSDDPDFLDVAAQVDGGIRLRPVEFLVSSYSLRDRQVNGNSSPQINFNIAEVSFPSQVPA